MVVYLFVRSASKFLVIPTLFSYAMMTLGSSMIWKLIGLLVLYLLGASSNAMETHPHFSFSRGSGGRGVFDLGLPMVGKI